MEMTSGLYLRPVEGSDADLLLQWRNDQAVRENSFQMDEISHDVHKKWLEATLADCNQEFFLLMKSETPIGQVRVQKEGNVGFINYSIAEPYRAQGFGKKILILLENYLIASDRHLSLTAYVKSRNIASQKIFEDLGYRRIDQSDVFSYQKELLEYRSIKDEQKYRGGVLFLTNNRNALGLHQWLCNKETVALYSGKLSLALLRNLQADIIVSYNYNSIISEEILHYMKGNVINLHISYLPWNRGSSPNFWSFIEDTTKGVTIHYVDKGLDTGDIIVQKKVDFDEKKETFASSYQKLNKEIIGLFKANWKTIKSRKAKSIKQSGSGSYHNMNDFKQVLHGMDMDWTMNIHEFKDSIGK